MKKSLFLPLQVSLCTVGYLCAFTNLAQAQVTTDGTVNTQVNQNGNVSEITGGETRGGNLFHSFQDFSVGTGKESFFNNASDITNIFSRVTGGNISNIDGLIRANDNASLFLINPAGIVFGNNARLDIGGSFYGSSASSILFEGGEFSAADLDNPPLLTVNAPIGLGFRDNPGQIVNRSIFNGVGLEVSPENSLALVGGSIFSEGGILTAPQGKIELGSVEETSIVSFLETDTGFDFLYDGIINFENIELTQGTLIDSSGEGSGIINLQGNLVSLKEGSQVRGETSGSVSGEDISIDAEILSIENGSSISNTTVGEGSAGDIDIAVSESIEIVGTGFEEYEQTFIVENLQGTSNVDTLTSGTGILTATTGTGTAGNIDLNTSNLNLTNGSVIGNFTFGSGATGNLTIDAAESLEVVSSAIFNLPTIGSTGNGDRISINTASLTISDSGFVSAIILGLGDGGDIVINATEQIDLLRTSSTSLAPAGIFANSIIGAGNAGDITIETPRLNLEDGAQLAAESGAEIRTGIIFQGGQAGDLSISATDSVNISGNSPDGFFPSFISTASFTSNDAGDLDLTTPRLSIAEGGGIIASTIGEGNGGNLTLDVSESITVSGISAENGQSSSILSSSGELLTGSEFDPIATSGNAGSLSITTDNLSILDEGRIAVDSFGSGSAGLLEINTNSLQIENRGQIEAETTFGEGGNIVLDVNESLILRNNSLISARARENANGGNIKIDTNFIVAFPSGNNDIVANALEGQGGEINIIAEALFGIEERPQNSLTNDIDASSRFNLDGDVTINTLDINIVQGATELPNNVIESEQTTQQACQANREAAAKNGFNVTGKGGIVPDPALPLNSSNAIGNNDINSVSRIPSPIETSQGKIQPARGIEITENGGIRLVAYRTNNAGERSPEVKRNCGQV